MNIQYRYVYFIPVGMRLFIHEVVYLFTSCGWRMVKMLKWQKDGMGFEVLCTLRHHHMGSFKRPWCTQCWADLTQSLFLTLEVKLLFFLCLAIFCCSIRVCTILSFMVFFPSTSLKVLLCYVQQMASICTVCHLQMGGRGGRGLGSFWILVVLKGFGLKMRDYAANNLMIRLTTCLLSFHERDDLCKD